MPITLDDLRGGQSNSQPECLADLLLQLRGNVRVGANRAGDLAHCDVLACDFQPPPMAPQFVVPNSQLETQGGRFGMHPMGTANHQRLAMRDSLTPDNRDEPVEFS